MERKQIQEQRMREYFLQATRDILKSEGLKAISVRNIAERAGYSYATLYNYFKDVKDLIFECVEYFQQECAEEIKAKTAGVPKGRKRLLKVMEAYLEYFIQYPGIFDLFFVEKLSDISSSPARAAAIVDFPDRLCADDWEYCIRKEQYTEEQAEKIKLQLRLAVTGLLLFYLNRRYPGTYPAFRKMATEQFRSLLEDQGA